MALDIDIGRINEPVLRDLAKKLADAADDRMVQLAQGAALDFADYKNRVGYLEALGTVLKVCVELDEERHGVRREQE